MADRPDVILLIEVGPRIIRERLDLDYEDQLACMYDLIDCRSVDVVRLAPGLDMWLDDEGLGVSPVNPLATILAGSFGFTAQAYHGRALITGNAKNGDTIGLTAEQMADVYNRLADALGTPWTGESGGGR